MSGDFWVRRRPRWVAAGLTAAVMSLTVWLLRHKSGPDTATILSLTVSVLSLGVAVRGLWPDPPLSQVARRLADQVAQERGAARRQALGVAGDFPPAPVGYRVPMAAGEPELVRWQSDGGAQSGTLADIAGYYRSLDRGRLVVLGEPGSGKTVLATQLVIDLAESLPGGDLQPGSRPPVPVWLSLPSLDLGETSALASPTAEQTAGLLDQWMAAQISAVHGISLSTAARLIRERWVLPVLDGLDEMDAAGSQQSGSRPRAAAVVRALNAGTGRRPVVLVCRRGEYRQLAASSAAIAETPVLQAASQVILQPLYVSAICDYLARRFPGEQAGTLETRWHSIRDHLQTATATAPASELAGALSSPWRLFLATATYHDSHSSPGEMLHHPPGTLSDHLLSQLIPALTQSTPRPGGSHYSSGDVTTWLSTLAQHLDHTSRHLNWSPTDLDLQRLWPIAGQAKVRRLSILATTAILCIGFAVPGLIWAHANGRWYPDTPAAWLGLIGAIGSLVYSTSLIFAANSGLDLQRLDLRLASPDRRKKLAAGLAAGLTAGLTAGLAAGLVIGLVIGLAAGLGLGLAFALAAGLVIGLAFGLAGDFSVADQPTSVMRQSVAFELAVTLAIGLAAGLGLGLAAGPGSGLAVGLGLGLAFALTFGLVSGLAIWVRYVIGCWLARRQGILPRRAGRFLDWAYRANLLRMSGIAPQFRHRELQVWLLPASPDRTAQPNQGADLQQAPAASADQSEAG
jgi:hypothetical protein